MKKLCLFILILIFRETESMAQCRSQNIALTKDSESSVTTGAFSPEKKFSNGTGVRSGDFLPIVYPFSRPA